jgi:hypothetical protein
MSPNFRLNYGGSLNLTKEMKAKKKKERKNRGFRQDHASRGNNHRDRETDQDWVDAALKRKQYRNAPDANLEEE